MNNTQASHWKLKRGLPEVISKITGTILKQKKSSLSKFVFIALLTSPFLWIISQGFILPTQALSALALNSPCSHCCGHSAQQRRIMNLWDKIWHHKNLFSPVCFFLHCAVLPDLMFERMTKSWDTFKHKRLEAVLHRAIDSPGQNASGYTCSDTCSHKWQQKSWIHITKGQGATGKI